MSAQHDLDYAKALQAEYDLESAQEINSASDGEVLFDPSSFSTPVNNAGGGFISPGRPVVSADESMSIVDPRWEMLDPSPDVRAMFMEFNHRYFWGRLAGVEVRWSPRMTLCAGLCCYEGRGGLCSVRLSTPLLKLRPRKDLVETLLCHLPTEKLRETTQRCCSGSSWFHIDHLFMHEMIHAYLFVTDNNKDHDGHGPEFCKHMNRLNKETGTSISIYHTFHDEVALYKQHWWKCNGPCQKRPPYFGMVKRAMNRAPAPRDPWWAQHQASCGGSYVKVKEPEGYGQKKGNKRKKETGVDSGEEGKDPKRRATDKRDKPSSPDKGDKPLPNKGHNPFPGKGKELGSSKTKEPTALQKWLADKYANHNNNSVPTKSKAPAALGAPPPSPDKKTKPGAPAEKETKAEPTNLEKWISKNKDNSKTSSVPAPSEAGSSKNRPGTDVNAQKTGAPGKRAGEATKRKRPINGKHSRKGSGKRQELLAIFDSDSDSDDELFVDPRKSKGRGGSLPGKGRSPITPVNNVRSPNIGVFSSTSSSNNATNTTPNGFHHTGNSGDTHRPIAKPNRDFATPDKDHSTPNMDFWKSGTALAGSNQHPARTTSDDARSKVNSPNKRYYPPYSSIGGSHGNGRPQGNESETSANDTGFYGSSAPVNRAITGGSVEETGHVKTVQCPICCTNVAEMDINAHLDRCELNTSANDTGMYGANAPVSGVNAGGSVEETGHVKTVQCPICCTDVAETGINAHLDGCLS